MIHKSKRIQNQSYIHTQQMNCKIICCSSDLSSSSTVLTKKHIINKNVSNVLAVVLLNRNEICITSLKKQYSEFQRCTNVG